MGASNGVKIPHWIEKTGEDFCPSCAVGKGRGFIEKNLEAITAFLKEVLEPDIPSNKNGLLQAIDPRARLFGIGLLILSSAILTSVVSMMMLLATVLVITIASQISINVLLKRVLPMLIFTLFLIFPAVFSFITPGTVVLEILRMDDFNLYISKEGLEGVSLLLLRVMLMVSLLSLSLLTTGYPDIFRALQSFPIPRFFITALSMTFRYIIVLLKVAEDSHLARKARTIKPLTLKEGQGWLASRMWFIMERSMQLAEGTYLAMTARGFTGEVKTVSVFEMRGRDYVWIGFAIFVLLLAVQL
ncbi:MAG: cobalt ECF transporter T component CbiQ [Deltaproteobacteria bacterium GWC2_42_51]|nr:MAG: cobalt ECF transporter T component CbiQ [Deltaproteobacteria bacterium GWA2_42_85]OGP28325.1 MAG: cobalt ECF transporter T component CbiQ [Deltaproteobacteria bacterium GWB2_42_7]OGP37210.1 MAG: cobalt ECF transporter T component CbiQ [Deltaproteobacteria bacterium GWC2_42_51]OGP39291.1 MAG: cobalt ECF transporter T component CbiQ [Deltaproteobacteria bacterium GWD2_42_10]OGP46656.1 MAG: cobalt ECF transporter T component CbiQ [Deltaproteobacteria bacterium GWF2_42_12]OGQ30198.1 MAG: c